MDFSYIDDTDRAYGAAGMAISLTIFDGENLMSGISLDNPDSDLMEMAMEWYAPAAPGLSVRKAWEQRVRHFHLATAMTLGNVICRRTVKADTPRLTEADRDALHRTVLEEADESCALEADEVDVMFNRIFNYLYHSFAKEPVRQAAHGLAGALQHDRSLTRGDILAHLAVLSMI